MKKRSSNSNKGWSEKMPPGMAEARAKALVLGVADARPGSDLAVRRGSELSTLVLTEEEKSKATSYLGAMPENTKRAYRADWAHYVAWCSVKHVAPMPATPEVVAAYLSAFAEELKASTLTRRLAAICKAHDTSGFPSPTRSELVTRMMAGIGKVRGTAVEKKSAITRDILNQMLDFISASRDRAILLLGFAGAFRRSEFMTLRQNQLVFQRDPGARTDGGPGSLYVVVSLGKTKTDQAGKGAKIAIAPNPNDLGMCPVQALLDYLGLDRMDALHWKGGTAPLFPSPTDPKRSINEKLVTRIIKNAVRDSEVGDPELFSAHSLRAGFVTEALRQGASLESVQAQTRHKSLDTVIEYRRESDPLSGSAAKDIWKNKEKS